MKESQPNQDSTRHVAKNMGEMNVRSTLLAKADEIEGLVAENARLKARNEELEKLLEEARNAK